MFFNKFRWLWTAVRRVFRLAAFGWRLAAGGWAATAFGRLLSAAVQCVLEWLRTAWGTRFLQPSLRCAAIPAPSEFSRSEVPQP